MLRGSKMVEMLIWSILVVPGPIYSFWRRTGRSTQCPHCHFPVLVKLDSADGMIARRKFDVELGLIKPEPKEKKNEETNINNFGNQRPAEPPAPKKPVDPDAW